jgi:broad-specificity NMP kinase
MIQDFDLIIIRGAPGVGKTTLGELLRTSDSIEAVIDVDEIRHMVHCEKFDYNDNTDYFKSLLVITKFVDFLNEKAMKPIFLIDVFSDVLLDFFLKNIKTKKFVVITLISTDEVLTNRMTNRGTGYINIEVACKVNCQIKNSLKTTDIRIDTTTLKPKAVLSSLLKAIDLL